MFNVEASVYNATLLGSGGALKYVRMASSVTCAAVQSRGIITVGAPRFQLRGYPAASSSVKLYKARGLASAAIAQATSSLSFTERQLSRFGSVAYAEAQSVTNLRSLRPNKFAASGIAVASGDVFLVAKGSLRGDFSASVAGGLKFTNRRYRRVSSESFCFTSASSRIHRAQKLLAAGSAQTYTHSILRTGKKLASSSYVLASSTTSLRKLTFNQFNFSGSASATVSSAALLKKRILKKTVFTGSASANSVSKIGAVSFDYVEERTMRVASDSRLMVVAGAR